MRNFSSTIIIFLLVCDCFLIAEESLDKAAEKKFQEFVAHAIVDEQFGEAKSHSNSPFGSIIAHVKPNSDRKKESPLRIWRCCECCGSKNLMDGDLKDFSMAIGKDRSKWPIYLYVFEYKSVSSDSAQVEVSTYYNMGRSETSRGGNSRLWEFKRKDDSWIVIKKTDTLFWD